MAEAAYAEVLETPGHVLNEDRGPPMRFFGKTGGLLAKVGHGCLFTS